MATRQSTKKTTRSKTTTKKKPKKVSRLHKPDHLSLEEWQVELRRQFGREQDFILTNRDDEKFFSEHEVTNPASQRSYRILIRGDQLFDNYCSCPDFATNTLGTCKHLEFALAQLLKKRGAKKAFREGFHPPHSEIYLHYGIQREVRFRPGSECTPKLARLVSKYFNDESILLPEAYAAFDIFIEQAREIDPELHIPEDAITFIAEVRDAENRRLRVLEAYPQGIRSADLKKLVSVKLYDYQKEGALFAAQAGRCLIGDEMGLGKTIQSIAATEIMAQLFGVERALIICPTSLKHQWEREIERFVNRSVEVIGGLRPRRETGFSTESFFKITNYDTIHTDLDLIEEWGPELVILDEAQRIKNWTTRTARSVKQIHTPYAIVLTGTPLENRLEELISIVQFVDRHRLGPTFRMLHEHQVRDEHGKVVGYRQLDKVNETLEPVLLRRQKKEVLSQLPERIDTNIFVPMTSEQMTLHTENKEIVARIVQRWRRHRFLSEADQRRLMIALERMRMSCDNTYLVDHNNDHGPKADEALVLMEEILEDPEAKIVVFSQWLRMHELLDQRLTNAGWGHVLFHGGVPSPKRKDLVDQFRNDEDCRIFLSTDAGGVGLNLQHASVIMNMDLPWNPAVLEQRIGRVHRMGQKQSVRVINFVSQGTIEEGMLSVLKFKKSLFAGVLDGETQDVFLGRRLDKFMEQVEASTSGISESVIEDSEEALRAPANEIAGPTDESDEGDAATPVPELQASSSTPGSDSTASADPMATLIQAGMTLLTQFVDSTRNGASSEKSDKPAQSQASNFVQRDEKTGEPFLKFPVPSKDVVEQALQTVGALLENLRNQK